MKTGEGAPGDTTSPSPAEEPPKDLKVLSNEITDKYTEVLKKRNAINESLNAFKVALKMSEDSDLSACFNAIKKTAGLNAKIEVLHTDPLELRVDEASWREFPEEYRDAVTHFNSMLRSCYELLNEKGQTLDYIDSRLGEIEARSGVETSAVAERDELKDIPVRISEFVDEVEALLGDINAATYFFGNDSLGFMPTGP